MPPLRYESGSSLGALARFFLRSAACHHRGRVLQRGANTPPVASVVCGPQPARGAHRRLHPYVRRRRTDRHGRTDGNAQHRSNGEPKSTADADAVPDCGPGIRGHVCERHRVDPMHDSMSGIAARLQRYSGETDVAYAAVTPPIGLLSGSWGGTIGATPSGFPAHTGAGRSRSILKRMPAYHDVRENVGRDVFLPGTTTATACSYVAYTTPWAIIGSTAVTHPSQYMSHILPVTLVTIVATTPAYFAIRVSVRQGTS